MKKPGHLHANTRNRFFFSFITNRPSVHAKPVNPLNEYVSFWNRFPEWFLGPIATWIRVTKYAFSKMSGDSCGPGFNLDSCELNSQLSGFDKN